MPRILADMVDVYVFRRWPTAESLEPSIELLQLYRVGGSLDATWHPVMGHIEEGETAIAAAVREMGEEVGLFKGEGLRGMWALEQVHPYFLAKRDAIVLPARFAAEVGPSWEPRLNGEHSAHRWIAGHQAARYFMWPGQVGAVREVVEVVVKKGLGEGYLRVDSLF